eukprot:Skav222173  [mRNA]  locus=scaffold3048:255216:256967:+ [translate_table: standard]
MVEVRPCRFTFISRNLRTAIMAFGPRPNNIHAISRDSSVSSSMATLGDCVGSSSLGAAAAAMPPAEEGKVLQEWLGEGSTSPVFSSSVGSSSSKSTSPR